LTSTYGRAVRKVGAGVLAATLSLATAAALIPGVASATATVTSTRYAGVDRYDTAAKAAIAQFPNGSNNLIVASGENFPDGLASAYLSGAAAAPILLTQKDSLPTVTANALGTLDSLAAGSATVHIMGGTAAVSQTVRDQIKALGYTLAENYNGTDRYDTAAKVATAANAIAPVASFNGLKTAIIATGLNFPDALAAGGLADANTFPILLVNTGIPAQTQAALTSLAIKQAIVMGGTDAVPTAVETALTTQGISVIRMAGVNRYDTAAKLGAMESATSLNGGFGWATSSVVLATGLNFPDALAASEVSGRAIGKAPIILTASLPAESSAFITAHSSTIANFFVMGGTAAVDAATLTAATTAATSSAPTATITAKDGATSVTVVFSGAVANATAPTSYTVNNGAAGNRIGVPTYDPATHTATVPITGAALVPNDVFTVNPTGALTPIADATTGTAVAMTSTTVVADLTKPTATIKAFSNTTDVYVYFDEPVTGVAPSLTSTDGKTATPLTFVDSAHMVWHGTWAPSAPATGQTANLLANAFQDNAAAHNKNNATSGIVVADTTKPTVVSAKSSVSPTGAAVYDLFDSSNPGDVTITAKSTGAAFGNAGNGWTFVNGGTNPTVAVSVNAATKQITIGGPTPAATDATAIATALTNNATFASLFTATVSSAGIIDLTDPATALDPTTAGTSTVTITVTFSEPLSAVAAPTVNTSTGVAVPVTAAGTNAETMWFGTASFTYPQPGGTNGTPVSVTFAANAFTDLATNGNLAGTTSVS